MRQTWLLKPHCGASGLPCNKQKGLLKLLTLVKTSLFAALLVGQVHSSNRHGSEQLTEHWERNQVINQAAHLQTNNWQRTFI